MATKGKVDSYANIASVAVVESAINTQTSVKFNFPFSIMDRIVFGSECIYHNALDFN
jgi:hypothetical protein